MPVEVQYQTIRRLQREMIGDGACFCGPCGCSAAAEVTRIACFTFTVATPKESLYNADRFTWYTPVFEKKTDFRGSYGCDTIFGTHIIMTIYGTLPKTPLLQH